ncbi:cell death regulator Aven [Porphyrio hochstetteri]
MQPERGGSRPRREGGRHGRRRPGGAESAAETAPEGSGRDGHGGGRGRGGAHGYRGGGGRGRREHRGRGAAPPPAAHRHRRVEEDDDTESQEEEGKEELKSYSRRKISSNWSRYEETEKERQAECGESQRGTDFSVLLSSAGDSFTQFRFADEKEWERESVCHKQLSALSIDCQSLVQALQELPLHLRLNIDAELVQASTPVELPQMKPKMIEDGKRRELLFRQSLAQSETALGSHPVGDSVAPSEPGSKNSPRASAAEPFRTAHPLSKQETDHLDEELDLLLNLDAPIDTEERPVSGALSHNILAKKDLETGCKEKDPLKLDVPEEKSTASQEQQSTPKNVTEEELEDWLDSMIS